MKRRKTTVSTKYEKVVLRKKIAELRRRGLTLAEIGAIVNRNPATVSRHLQDIQADMIEDVSSLPSKEMEAEDYEREFKEAFKRYDELRSKPDTDPREVDIARLTMQQARQDLNTFNMEQELRQQKEVEDKETNEMLREHSQLHNMKAENRANISSIFDEIPNFGHYDEITEYKTEEERKEALRKEGKARAKWLKENKPSQDREGMTEVGDIIIRDYNDRASEGKRTAYEKAGSNRTQPRRKN
jgi:DNA-binding CsgD family transcriptional regulator